MEMLNLVRNNVPSGDALQMVSGMIEKTNRLMTQFRVVKKQLVREFFFFLFFFFIFHFPFFQGVNSFSCEKFSFLYET